MNLTTIWKLVLSLAIIVGLLPFQPTNQAYASVGPSSNVWVANDLMGIGETSLVTITFSHAVSNFDNTKLTVDNGTLSTVSSIDGGVTWTATLTPATGISVVNNKITLDNTGIIYAGYMNGTGITESNEYSIDMVRPTASIDLADDILTVNESSQVTITFSEEVIGFSNADLTVQNGSLSTVTSSDGGVTWEATLTPVAGLVAAINIITMNNGSVVDVAGNIGPGNTVSNNYAIYTQNLTSSVVVADSELTAGETSLVTITFSEVVSDLSSAVINVENGRLSTFSSSDGGLSWTATLTPDEAITDNSNVVTLDNESVFAVAGNTGTGISTSNNYTVVTTLPTSSIAVTDDALTMDVSSLVTITFSEAVKGFSNADLTIMNGTLSEVTSSDGGLTWTATLNPIAGVRVEGNMITLDNAGVANVAGNVGRGLTTSNHYSVSTLSTSSELRGLTLSSGTLSPALSSGTSAYTTDVPYATSGLTITASVYSSATMTVNGIAVMSGMPTSVIPLIEGDNIITVVVTAEDHSTSTYTITVKRGHANTSPSDSGGGGSTTTTTTTPINSTVTATDGKLILPIGKSGKVSLGEEIVISVPSGAALRELILSITKVLNTADLFANKEVLASPVFEIMKNFSENFSKPVTLTLAFDPTILKSHQTVSVFYYDEVKKEWLHIEGGKILGNEITVNVDHFTKFAVLVVDQITGAPVTDQPINMMPEVKFRDISGHWAEASIKLAVSTEIVKGYLDGTFQPDTTVTRAEFSVMLMNALNSEEEVSELNFTDQSNIGAWAKKAISQAVQAEIIQGYEDGTFRPNRGITRSEMAVMIVNALKLSTESNISTAFADDQDIPSWAKDAVGAMKKQGYIEGTGMNEFNPTAQTTRAEAITVLLRILE